MSEGRLGIGGGPLVSRTLSDKTCFPQQLKGLVVPSFSLNELFLKLSLETDSALATFGWNVLNP